MTDHQGSQHGPDFAAPPVPPADPGDRQPGPGTYGSTRTVPPQAFPAQPIPTQGFPAQGFPAQGAHGWPPHLPATPEPPVQRPAMITLSVVLIVTGSLLWMTALGFVWLTAYVARDGFSYTGVEGSIYHMLARFHLRMLDGGLAIVFFGFPTAAVVLAFFLLIRRGWPRIAISALGAAAVAVPGVLLRDNPGWIVPWAGYIAFSCLILWAPSVGRWCRADPRTGRMAG